MDGRAKVQALDGQPIIRINVPAMPAIVGQPWKGFFVGSLAIENIDERDDTISFDLLVPTSASDANDFIWEGEIETGTTDKIVFLQNASLLAARVVHIRREGPGARWDPAPLDRYRFTVELPTSALGSDGPLELRIRWNRGGETVDVAQAAAAPT